MPMPTPCSVLIDPPRSTTKPSTRLIHPAGREADPVDDPGGNATDRTQRRSLRRTRQQASV
jgi:hypothetical protein